MLVAIGAALVLSSAVAVAAVKVGTAASETITGTHSPDIINGKGGNDTLKGLAGNDVYQFADGFGEDTLEELASYKVGKRRLPGGTDTLNFSRVTTDMTIYLVPQWPASGNAFGNQASTTGTDGILHKVSLGSSLVENATGGSGSFDWISSGGGSNTLRPGGGAFNILRDFAGWKDGAEGQPGIPTASNDTYRGFQAAPNGAVSEVGDWGGTADTLVLPGESSDYYIDSVNLDASPDGSEESLLIYNTTNNTTVRVLGHFGDYANWSNLNGLNGKIEQLVFADGAFATTAQVQQLMNASASLNDSAEEAVEEQVVEAQTEREQVKATGASRPPASAS